MLSGRKWGRGPGRSLAQFEPDTGKEKAGWEATGRTRTPRTLPKSQGGVGASVRCGRTTVGFRTEGTGTVTRNAPGTPKETEDVCQTERESRGVTAECF
jgi:hypothetical protein